MQEEVVNKYRERLRGKLYSYLEAERLLSEEPLAFSCAGCGGTARIANEETWFCPECGRSGGLMELAALRWPARGEWDRIRALCRILRIPVTELEAFSSRELRDMALQPRDYLVEGLLPREGLTLLAAPAKTGKSWLVLQLASALVRQQPFLGRATHKTRVLYLSLEDNPLRLRERSRVMDCLSSPDLYFCTRSELLGRGFEEGVDSFLQRQQGIGLVIVDTLQKIREVGRESPSYGADYRTMDLLKELSERYHLAVLLVHHTNKKEEAADSMNMVSGTMGIIGGVDGIWLLRRPKRLEGGGVMQVTGRDTDDMLLRLNFDKESCRWQYLGEGEAETWSPPGLVESLDGFLEEGEAWVGTATELLEQLGLAERISCISLGGRLKEHSAQLAALGIGWERRLTGRRRELRLWRRGAGERPALGELREEDAGENPFLS